MQEIIIYIILIIAVSYIGYRAYKRFTKKKCEQGNCGCK